MNALPLLFVLGCCTGVTTVLFGFGGGFLTVPVVYWYVLTTTDADHDLAIHVATATSAAVMIVNAAIASVSRYRAGQLDLAIVRPLALPLVLGGLLGALCAEFVTGATIRVLFVAYLVITILDTVLRRGFLSASDDQAPAPSRSRSTVTGVGIGWVASFLGVGGSVMTVPMLRRRGMSMGQATALANPLTLPVAVAAFAVYVMGDSGGSADTSAATVGLVDFGAAGALLAGSLPTIPLVKRLATSIPDRVHAVTYVGLLIAVTLTMALPTV